MLWLCLFHWWDKLNFSFWECLQYFKQKFFLTRYYWWPWNYPSVWRLTASFLHRKRIKALFGSQNLHNAYLFVNSFNVAILTAQLVHVNGLCKSSAFLCISVPAQSGLTSWTERALLQGKLNTPRLSILASDLHSWAMRATPSKCHWRFVEIWVATIEENIVRLMM